MLIALFCLAGCSAIYLKSDLENPCSSLNSVECERCKKNYPKEYDRYQERVKRGADLKAGLRKTLKSRIQDGPN